MTQYTIKMIEEDNIKHLSRFRQTPPSPSYLAGFIDGDGCIFIRKITDGYQSGITITQCRTNILQVVRYHFGGSITSCSKRNDKMDNIMDDEGEYYHKYNVRNQYNLLIRSNEYSVLIEYLNGAMIIKNKQYQYLRQFSKIANLTSLNEDKETLYNMCSQLNTRCEVDEEKLSNINIEYIAGIFDAEGCIYIDFKNYNGRLSIAQKNHPKILNAIMNYLGFGRVLENQLIIWKQPECLQFVSLVKNYLIVKHNQANAFETLLSTTDKEIKHQMYIICNREKHEIENFDNLNQNTFGKEGYFQRKRIEKQKEELCKEIKLKKFYRDKSDKMKGTGNHNFGKSFTEETKYKMSISIRNAKNGPSDKLILEVRNLIEKGFKNIEIQEMLELPRHTVTRIKNGDIVCRTEAKQTRITMSQEQINLSKRKIHAEEILCVIEKLVDNWKPMQIFDHLSEIRAMNNIPNTISIDIIKNIKRNLLSGKSVIYDSELSEEKYKYYLSLTSHFTC